MYTENHRKNPKIFHIHHLCREVVVYIFHLSMVKHTPKGLELVGIHHQVGIHHCKVLRRCLQGRQLQRLQQLRKPKVWLKILRHPKLQVPNLQVKAKYLMLKSNKWKRRNAAQKFLDGGPRGAMADHGQPSQNFLVAFCISHLFQFFFCRSSWHMDGWQGTARAFYHESFS